MDTGEGRFQPLDQRIFEAYMSGQKQKPEKAGGIFSVGEELEIKGSRFMVRKITRKDLILRLLPKR